MLPDLRGWPHEVPCRGERSERGGTLYTRRTKGWAIGAQLHGWGLGVKERISAIFPRDCIPYWVNLGAKTTLGQKIASP